MQIKKKDAEKVGAVSEEGIIIKSTVDMGSKITMDDAKTIQDEEDNQIEVFTASTDRGLRVVIDI